MALGSAQQLERQQLLHLQLLQQQHVEQQHLHRAGATLARSPTAAGAHRLRAGGRPAERAA
eukprot:6877011-Prymnesium_polylepis.1